MAGAWGSVPLFRSMRQELLCIPRSVHLYPALTSKCAFLCTSLLSFPFAFTCICWRKADEGGSWEQMSGVLKVDGSGNVELKEEDGIDYAPVTVQLPGGERVPFLFTVKELSAKGSLNGFGGEFVVPSYRGSSFLDPKVLPPFRHSESACSCSRPSARASLMQRTRPCPCNVVCRVAGPGRFGCRVTRPETQYQSCCSPLK